VLWVRLQHTAISNNLPIGPPAETFCRQCVGSATALSVWRTVHLDGCVEVEAAYYGEPPGWIGRRVQVQWDSRQVRLLNPETGELLREHLRQVRGRHRIKDEDRPKKKPLGIQQLL
jgi:hypothetical protein